MHKIIYKKSSINDLTEIFNYINQDNNQIAIKVQETIFDFISNLALFPMIGKQVGDSIILREIVEPTFKYRIIYKIENNNIFIISIFKNKNLF